MSEILTSIPSLKGDDLGTFFVYIGYISPFLIALVAWIVTRNRTGAETTEKIAVSFGAAMDRADKERVGAERREKEALEREHQALLREAEAIEKSRVLQRQLDACMSKAEGLQRQLDGMERTVTRLQDQVQARDETIVNQAATIRALRGSNGNGSAR